MKIHSKCLFRLHLFQKHQKWCYAIPLLNRLLTLLLTFTEQLRYNSRQRGREVTQIQLEVNFNLKKKWKKNSGSKLWGQVPKDCPLLKWKIVFFSPGHECTHDPLLILHCSSPVQHSESNPLRCQMRPITSPTNQSFPATEPTSNSLIENKAPVDVRWSTPHNYSQPPSIFCHCTLGR